MLHAFSALGAAVCAPDDVNVTSSAFCHVHQLLVIFVPRVTRSAAARVVRPLIVLTPQLGIAVYTRLFVFRVQS